MYLRHDPAAVCQSYTSWRRTGYRTQLPCNLESDALCSCHLGKKYVRGLGTHLIQTLGTGIWYVYLVHRLVSVLIYWLDEMFLFDFFLYVSLEIRGNPQNF